jgi:hypothetical protein
MARHYTSERGYRPTERLPPGGCRTHMRPTLRSKIGAALLAGSLLSAGAGCLTGWLYPRQWVAEPAQIYADIDGGRRQLAIARAKLPPPTNQWSYGSHGFEIMESERVMSKWLLYPVIERFGLEARQPLLADATNYASTPRYLAYRQLRRRLRFETRAPAKIVQLAVVADAPGEAIEMANAIAARYLAAVELELTNSSSLVIASNYVRWVRPAGTPVRRADPARLVPGAGLCLALLLGGAGWWLRWHLVRPSAGKRLA